jgi:hypothetical protein
MKGSKMALVNIDTTNEELLKKPVYTPAPAGIYEFAVSSTKIPIGKSKSNGNPMITVESRCISDVPYTGTDGAEKNTKGLKFKEYFVLNDESKWKLAQFCKAVGVEADDGKLDTDEFIGQEFSAKVKIAFYEVDVIDDDGIPGKESRSKNEIEEYVWETE